MGSRVGAASLMLGVGHEAPPSPLPGAVLGTPTHSCCCGAGVTVPGGVPTCCPLPAHRPPEPVPFCKAFYFHVRKAPALRDPGIVVLHHHHHRGTRTLGGHPVPKGGWEAAASPGTPMVTPGRGWRPQLRTQHQARGNGGCTGGTLADTEKGTVASPSLWHTAAQDTAGDTGHSHGWEAGMGGVVWFFSLFLYLQNSWLLPPGWEDRENPSGGRQCQGRRSPAHPVRAPARWLACC